MATVSHYASPVWRRLKLIGPQAEPHVVWKLGRGHIFFWHDCWMGDTTLADQFPQLPHSSIQVHDFFDDTGRNIDKLIQIIPYTIAEQIGSILLTPHVDDQIMWTHTSDGRFVTKSAWQLVRTGSTIQAVYRMIWSSIIPTTDSFFCWRLWQGLIPVDVVIQRRIGSHMASSFLVSLLPPPPLPTPTLVFWRTPLVGSYKINTDGCVKDRFASGGGVIRDSSGQCIRAFFSFYGDCTILEAELRAILDGIILA
ncbi:Uncharacterized protein Adt_49387 [Abeliophyllum distichum]|uniref:RNase H type-1 domain-containing protein n=1 Tax=Abeliophyllum distichum TaxID=126358 RepID=A0ABD1NPV4_9LAMI